MNDLDLLENAAVNHMTWESNDINTYGSMAYFGEGNLQQRQQPPGHLDIGAWLKDPKNLMILGGAALVLILLYMVVTKKD